MKVEWPKPIPKVLIQKTVHEKRGMSSGYTHLPARGRYWDDLRAMGVSDELLRFEVDGVFTRRDLRALPESKRRCYYFQGQIA
jgi:hypothetical protein